jgi:two-component system OmpR family response regulator
MTTKILMVEDDRAIRDALTDYLGKNDIDITEAHDGAQARQALAKSTFDLILLDIMMPGEDGLSLCRYIRENLDLPIILLTARGDDADRILGLEMGADDYVAKPFNPRELLARINSVIRRANAVPAAMRISGADNLRFGHWVLKLGERELIGDDGVAAPLSTGEFALLRAFVERPRRVLTREYLLEQTRGADADIFDRSIDNQVSRLRKKIEANPADPRLIKTVRGDGDMLSVDVQKI